MTEPLSAKPKTDPLEESGLDRGLRDHPIRFGSAWFRSGSLPLCYLPQQFRGQVEDGLACGNPTQTAQPDRETR